MLPNASFEIYYMTSCGNQNSDDSDEAESKTAKRHPPGEETDTEQLMMRSARNLQHQYIV